jgi:hypothetical protein
VTRESALAHARPSYDGYLPDPQVVQEVAEMVRLLKPVAEPQWFGRNRIHYPDPCGVWPRSSPGRKPRGTGAWESRFVQWFRPGPPLRGIQDARAGSVFIQANEVNVHP